MFAAQLAASILAWAAVVFAMVRGRRRLIRRMAKVPRARRVWVSLLLLALSVAVLAMGMGALAAGGLTPIGLTLWAWPLITLVGAAFVVLQTLALVPLVLNAVEPVTARDARTSDIPNADLP